MGSHVIIVGLGNIGSYTCDLVARLVEVSAITLVDPDIYTAENQSAQRIERSEVGRAKAEVQARRLRAARPDLAVHAFTTRVEDLPWGRLRGNVLLAGLDTRIGRMYCNEVAWRLGMPWIDAGVSGPPDLIARVSVYRPAPAAPCYECGFTEESYQALETPYHCSPALAAVPSGSPAFLGAMAASLQAAECYKLLAGHDSDCPDGCQVLIEARNQRQWVTRCPKNPSCRFDHQVYTVEPAPHPAKITVRQALRLGGGKDGDRTGSDRTLGAPGRLFVCSLTCSDCGHQLPRATPALRPETVRCPRCQGAMAPGPFGVQHYLRASDVIVGAGRTTLSKLGFRPGDLFSVSGAAGERHFELAGHRHGEEERE